MYVEGRFTIECTFIIHIDSFTKHRHLGFTEIFICNDIELEMYTGEQAV